MGSRRITRRRAALAGVVLVVVAAAIAIPLALLSGSTSPSARTSASREAAAMPALAVTSFAGYPGQQPLPGAPRLEVNAIASAAGQRLAVGGADGYPAVWKQDTNGTWVLVTSPGALPAQSAPEALTSVTYGPAGWLAVGVPGPVVLSSENGTTWQPAAGGIAADLGRVSVVSATAGPRGYVILGKLAVSGGGCVADVWWSPDLASWKRAHDVNETAGSSQTLAVAALASGFVSVGSHDGKPAAWVTSDGTTWRTIVLPGPDNAELNQIAVIGSLVVATGGTDGQGAGTAAFAVSSPDAGTTWRQEALQLPQPGTVVTALAAGGPGFIAAGQYGKPGEQQVVVWERPADGRMWTKRQISGLTGSRTARTHEITALEASADDVTALGPVAPQVSRQVAVLTLPARS